MKLNSSSPKSLSQKAGVYYGWYVVGSAFTVMCVSFGTVYTFATFFQPLQSEFKASRADVSLIFALAGFLYFSLGAISGPLADRYGPRPIAAIGIGLISLGLLLSSFTQQLWQIYLTYSLSIGFGVGFAYVPSVGAVQRWFIKKRGVASGLATTGIGVGTLAAPPLAAALIELAGWRTAYLILAAITAVLGAGALLLLEHSPQRRGLLPDGVLPTMPSATPEGVTSSNPGPAMTVALPANQEGFTLRQVLRSGIFWRLYLACSLTSFGLFIPFVHLTAYARDTGLPEAIAVLLISLIGVGSTVGRFVIGGSADRIGRRYALIGVIGGMAATLLWWSISSSSWSLIAFALVFGVCYGGFVALMPALLADYFGARSVSGIIGLLYTSVAFGALLGPSLAGFAFDLSRTYTLPIIASAVANLLAVFCMLITPKPAVVR